MKAELLTDFLSRTMPPTYWLIKDWLPVGGITFLHAPTSIGKSPITWAVAQSVSDGCVFFGYPVETTGPVVYLEVDTPENLIHPRLSLLRQTPKQVWMLNLYPGVNITAPTLDLFNELTEINTAVKPVLVVINTLRKTHSGDDKLSETPSRVYQALHKFFPDAAKLVVHHDRKSIRGQGAENDDPDQAFSGAQNWANDAQVAWHLISVNKKERRVRLEMTKSQVSAIPEPLSLRLSEDGTNWLNQNPNHMVDLYNSLNPQLPKMVRYRMVGDELGVSDHTVRRAITGQADPDTDPETEPPELSILGLAKTQKPVANRISPIVSDT